jgi:hypothetical protein
MTTKTIRICDWCGDDAPTVMVAAHRKFTISINNGLRDDSGFSGDLCYQCASIVASKLNISGKARERLLGPAPGEG